MFQNIIQTESHNTQFVYSTVLYCTVLSAEQNDRRTVTENWMLQTVMQNESHNTQYECSTVLYSTLLSAEQNERFTVTAI